MGGNLGYVEFKKPAVGRFRVFIFAIGGAWREKNGRSEGKQAGEGEIAVFAATCEESGGLVSLG